MRLLTFCSVLLVAATSWAQTGVDVQVPGVRVQTNADSDAGTNQANQYDRSHAAPHEKRIVRASELIGLNVVNHNDESVGEINDLVIDPNDGRLRYVALSTGGVLGVGDELFAIPWTSFECRRDGDEHKVVLNVDNETFENAKGFNQNNWPDMANEQWQQENDRIFLRRSTDRRLINPPSVR